MHIFKKIVSLLATLLCVGTFFVTADTPDGYILVFNEEASVSTAKAFIESNGYEPFTEIAPEFLWYKTYDKGLAEALERQGLLDYYERDVIIDIPDEQVTDIVTPKKAFRTTDTASLLATPISLPYYQWSHDATSTTLAHKLGITGKGVIVGVVDSGSTPTHPDLSGNVLTGYDHINSTVGCTDKVGHGTMVSGFIASKYNDYGTTGVAPEATVLPQKVTETSGGINMSNVAAGIRRAVEEGAKIINLSLGADTFSKTAREAVEYAYLSDVIVCAASGNDGNTTVRYPAGYDNVIGVGSVKWTNQPAKTGEQIFYDGVYTRYNGNSGSNYNAYVDIVAPGGDVASTHYNGGYASGSGTSYATPYIAGVAALATEIFPKMTPDEFETLIKNTADKSKLYGLERNDEYGYGLVDTGELVVELLCEKYDEWYIPPIYHDYGCRALSVASVMKLSSDSLTILNTTDETDTRFIVIAGYDENGRLVDTVCKNVTLDVGEYVTLDVTSVASADSIKLFYFDSDKTMSPDCEPIILK